MSQQYRPPAAPATRGSAEPARWWPALVVVVGWAAVAVGLTRPDAVRARADVPADVKWLFYDECDLTAFALRGLNAAHGRPPGRLDEPAEPSWYDPGNTLADRLDGPHPPLADRFYLEYPTPALGLFRLPFGRGERMPPAPVADGHQYGVAFHVPRTDDERLLWGRLAGAVRAYIGVMAAAGVGLIVIAGLGYGPGLSGGPVWLAALPAAAFFTVNRFDVLPALATAVAFRCLGKGAPGWAGAWLAAGAGLKVYPVLLVPVVVRYLGRRDGAKLVAGFGFVAGALAFASLSVHGWDGTVGPIRVQLGRPFEPTSWTLYGRLLPVWLAEHGNVRLGLLASAVLASAATRPRDLAAVLRRGGLVLIGFVSLAVFWSPQWVVWLLPVVIPLAARRTALVAPAVALDLLNYLTFPVLFWVAWPRLDRPVAIDVAEVLVYARAAAWGWLAGVLMRGR